MWIASAKALWGLRYRVSDTPLLCTCSYFQLPKRFLEQLQKAVAGAVPQDPETAAQSAGSSEVDSSVRAGQIPPGAEATAAASPPAACSRQDTAATAADEPAALRDDSLEAAAARLAERIAQSGASDSSTGAGNQPVGDQWEVFNDLAADWGDESSGGSKKSASKARNAAPERLPEAAAAAAAEAAAGVPVLCARCHSLTHYGCAHRASDAS